MHGCASRRNLEYCPSRRSRFLPGRLSLSLSLSLSSHRMPRIPIASYAWLGKLTDPTFLNITRRMEEPSRRAWIFCHVLSRVCACRNDFAISDAKTVVNIINTRHCHRCSMLEFHLRNDRGMPASVSRRSQVSCGKGNNKCIRQPTRVNLRACIYIYIYICILVYVYIYIYMSYLAEMNIKIAREADSSGSIAPPLLIFSLLDRG